LVQSGTGKVKKKFSTWWRTLWILAQWKPYYSHGRNWNYTYSTRVPWNCMKFWK